MAWAKATFKDKDVWVEVDASGRLKVEGGRVPIRYSANAGAKIYRGSGSGVSLVGLPAEELPEGTAAVEGAAPAAAPIKPASRGSGFGKAGERSEAQTAAAARDARSRLASLPLGTIVAFTDGACTGNPGPAGSGMVLRFPDGRSVERFKALGRATNNIGELSAIALALDCLDEEAVPNDSKVAIFTDSEYSRGVLSMGWKAKANQELIAGILVKMKRRTGLSLHWVAGHAGVADNERADVLARKGVEASQKMR